MHTKKLSAKQVWRTWVKVKKVHISFTFLLITFFGCIFVKLFQQIRNQCETLRFLIPILNFVIKKMLLLLALFVHFDCKCAGNGSKKRNFFKLLCLRILICNHQKVCITKLLKSLYPNKECGRRALIYPIPPPPPNLPVS